ncbi:MAG TPA: hypothetical protein PLP17_12330, partial [Oligoflexia bacterium]|nr:hypothetical protein [Oligoflexia bacterium]
MDLYRYFHPHYNPRLRKVPLRLQELAELEQAATELRNALQRAAVRTRNAPIASLSDASFSEVLAALDFIVESLAELTQQHPGDDAESMKQLLLERQDAPGWENWAKLLQQRLALFKVHGEGPRINGLNT